MAHSYWLKRKYLRSTPKNVAVFLSAFALCVCVRLHWFVCVPFSDSFIPLCSWVLMGFVYSQTLIFYPIKILWIRINRLYNLYIHRFEIPIRIWSDWNLLCCFFRSKFYWDQSRPFEMHLFHWIPSIEYRLNVNFNAMAFQYFRQCGTVHCINYWL